MKKDSPKAKALAATLRDKHEAIFKAMSDVLAAHGHPNVRVRSFGVEGASECPGGVPKVPVKINTPNGPMTIWVCPS
jgi:hypothetical protein